MRKALTAAMVPALGSVLFVFLVIQIPAAMATVHVSPNGPAGQQYAVPLDSARGEASGDASAGAPGSDAKPPLFGQGIKPGGQGGGDGSIRASGGSGGGHATDIQVAIKSGSGGSSKGPLIAGLIAAVALIGAGGGLLARRFSTESQA
jgi:hypothetical protein